MMRKITNKRADVPIMILVIGTVAVFVLALLSFFYSSAKFKQHFIGIEILEEMNSQIEKYNADAITQTKLKGVPISNIAPNFPFNGRSNQFLEIEKRDSAGIFGWVWWDIRIFRVRYYLP